MHWRGDAAWKWRDAGGGRALALFTHGRRGKKGFPKKPAAQSASPASHPSLSLSLSPGSSSPSPSASPSLTGCNDCAAQHGRVWQRLISQTPGTAPLHPGQKQTSLRLLILNWRFCIVSPLLHPGLGNKTINLLTLTRRKRFPYAHK